jgi:hypothetical protein
MTYSDDLGIEFSKTLSESVKALSFEGATWRIIFGIEIENRIGGLLEEIVEIDFHFLLIGCCNFEEHGKNVRYKCKIIILLTKCKIQN